MFPLSTPLPLKNYLYYPKKEILQGCDFRTFAETRKNSYNEAAKEVCDMKKARIIAVIAALIVSLSGCANTDRPQTIQDSSGIETMASETYERTKPEDRSSASVSESKESTADSPATVKAETESAQAENSQPIAEQSPAAQKQSPQTAVPNNTPKHSKEGDKKYEEIIFIIVEHHTFLRIDRILQFCIQLIDLSIQILISLHIQNQTIHTK